MKEITPTDRIGQIEGDLYRLSIFAYFLTTALTYYLIYEHSPSSFWNLMPFGDGDLWSKYRTLLILLGINVVSGWVVAVLWLCVVAWLTRAGIRGSSKKAGEFIPTLHFLETWWSNETVVSALVVIAQVTLNVFIVRELNPVLGVL